ncbi:MAG: hypothetical protein MUC57_08665 [Desulfobacterales bacterium]|jgi:hypothetical protein|nr:hypothetical protein [Desulfobacterales bacterium]
MGDTSLLCASFTRPHRDCKFARIVIFDNNQRVGVPTSPLEIIQVFGIIHRQLKINQNNGQVKDEGWSHGPQQIINRDRKKYISALAVNIPKATHVYYSDSDIELPMRLQIIQYNSDHDYII